jgi:hypothetical protein
MATAYSSILDIAHKQAQLLARGELESAVALIQTRQDLLDAASSPNAQDVEAIKEIMRLDRDLSSAIRERMIAIRQEALEGQAGRRALNGYGRTVAAHRQSLDRRG